MRQKQLCLCLVASFLLAPFLIDPETSIASHSLSGYNRFWPYDDLRNNSDYLTNTKSITHLCCTCICNNLITKCGELVI